MNRRRPISTLFALSTFGCVIEPGVLEGGDEVDDSGDTSETDIEGETGEALLAECLQGTNAAGSSDPGDFPIDACELICDEGWGHASPAIPIAWTLHFEALEPDGMRSPFAVIARSGGDGVVVISRGDIGTELVTVSSDGGVLGITTLPTSRQLEQVEAVNGVIYLAYHDGENDEVVAIDETGELLWSSPQPGPIQDLAAVPGGGVIVGADASLTRLASNGSTSWTAPSITARSVEVSAMGNILVGGYELGQIDHPKLALYSDLGEPIESIEMPGSSERLWDLHFLTERRFFASGTRFDLPSIDASALVVDLDDPELAWNHEYNRALTFCDEGGVLVHGATSDWFGQTAMLADGTLLVVGAEAGPALPDGDLGVQPRVVHLDHQGEFLASDRGLWFGHAAAVAADDDGSAYVALTTIHDPHEPIHGFHLRKYQP